MSPSMKVNEEMEPSVHMLQLAVLLRAWIVIIEALDPILEILSSPLYEALLIR